MDATGIQAREYHPELISRRGEVTAWGLAAVGLVAWGFLVVGGYGVNVFLPILTVLLILAGMAISLGNWMDRHTVIRVDADGIEYHNGLRNTRLAWGEIRRLEIRAHKWGDKVRVLGDDAHFAFRTFGEVKVGGETKGAMGFAGGDQIVKTILDATGLKEIDRDENGYYYERV